MANATDVVKKGTVRRHDEFMIRPLASTAAERYFYPQSLLGLDLDGYEDKLDDTKSMLMHGVTRGQEGRQKQPVSSDGDHTIGIHQSFRLELAIAGVEITDIGKKVYALDDQTGTLSAAATTFANLVGTVVDKVASGIALVEPAYDGVAAHKRLGASKVLAATGAQSLTKFDLNKTIIVPNTGAYSITLPAAADTQAGDRLHFVKTTADAVAATLDANASEVIDNATTLATIDARYDCATLVSTGTEWVVENRDIA